MEERLDEVRRMFDPKKLHPLQQETLEFVQLVFEKDRFELFGIQWLLPDSDEVVLIQWYDGAIVGIKKGEVMVGYDASDRWTTYRFFDSPARRPAAASLVFWRTARGNCVIL